MKHTKLLALSVIMGMGLALGMYAMYTKARAAIAQENARLVSIEPDEEETRLRTVSKTGHDITPLPRAQVEKLASTLNEEAYRITQKAGTEPAHCGTLLDNKREGVYSCVVCGLPLFSSEHKFDSGSGWPSFYQEYDPEHVKRLPDNSIAFMPRVEIECARCDAHLGHVFEDGPKPTGERHCLNSASLVFTDKGADLPEQHTADASAVPTATETAYFAGGCFWGIEHYFQKGDGVLEAVSGYMQGRTDDPTYKEICYEDTGHAEAVKVVFDPTKISYEELLRAFFIMHDPTQLNRQGPDVGTQYRSGIYYVSDEQKQKAEAFIKVLTDEDVYKRPIVTEVEKAETFWEAEDYHQDYILKTGRACHVRNPWN